MVERSVAVPNELRDKLAADFALGALNGRGRRLVEAELLACFDGLKIELFSNEYPPPHFRVYFSGESNDFSIRDCEPLNGQGLSKFFRNTKEWHAEHKKELINAWNRLRLTDCPVGRYRE